MGITPKETKNTDKIPRPSAPEFHNPQLNLFQDFLCNTKAERDNLSNAIDLWDNVPRYSISRKAMDEARIDGLFLKSHRAEFQYKGRTYLRIVTPARVQDLDGKEREYYASANEELIEDALRKIATEQFSGYFDKPNYSSGVVFTLYMLREELKRRGHTRSYQEIVLGLNIMHHSNIEIAEQTDEGRQKSVLSSPYLPVLAIVTRGHLRDDPKAKWMVQFHPFVTGSIDQVTYRQFNYHLMMSHSTQLARWLHKQLVLKYTFASLTIPFEMRYSTVKRDSALLENYTRSRAAIDALHQALTELQKHKVLLGFSRENITGPRGKLLDAVFTLTASMDFIHDTKAGSKRLTLATRNSEPNSVGLTGGSRPIPVGLTGGSR
ncbi:MAG: replication protein [Deltaproteobacteria bacterium]|nr:replication protein [Deltaproteobacteria bacterium]